VNEKCSETQLRRVYIESPVQRIVINIECLHQAINISASNKAPFHFNEMNYIFVPFTIHRNHYYSSGSAVLRVSFPKQLFYALSHTSCITTTRAKNWILRPYLVSARWIEEGSTILVADTFYVLTSVISKHRTAESSQIHPTACF